MFFRLNFLFGIIPFLFPPLIQAQDVNPPPIQSNIPIQVPIDHPQYEAFFERATEGVEPDTNQCALIFNRMMAQRFGSPIFGSAWTIQIKQESSTFLKHIWQLPESSFRRHEDFRLYKKEDRIRHFEHLYSLLEREEYPIGLIGFVYKFSNFKQTLLDFPQFVPQTHVSFLAGKKEFFFENTFQHRKTIEQLIEIKYGNVLDHERSFVDNKIPLNRILNPGEQFFYTDYLVEEQFRTLKRESLLEVFLRKHRNNRITPLLRPVSFSRISDEIILSIELQKTLLSKYGALDYISGDTFRRTNFEGKEAWKSEMRSNFRYLDRNDWRNIPVVPVPKYRLAMEIESGLESGL